MPKLRRSDSWNFEHIVELSTPVSPAPEELPNPSLSSWNSEMELCLSPMGEKKFKFEPRSQSVGREFGPHSPHRTYDKPRAKSLGSDFRALTLPRFPFPSIDGDFENLHQVTIRTPRTRSLTPDRRSFSIDHWDLTLPRKPCPSIKADFTYFQAVTIRKGRARSLTPDPQSFSLDHREFTLPRNPCPSIEGEFSHPHPVATLRKGRARSATPERTSFSLDHLSLTLPRNPCPSIEVDFQKPSEVNIYKGEVRSPTPEPYLGAFFPENQSSTLPRQPCSSIEPGKGTEVTLFRHKPSSEDSIINSPRSVDPDSLTLYRKPSVSIAFDNEFSPSSTGLCPDWEDWDPRKNKQHAKEAMDAAEEWLDVPQVSRICMKMYIPPSLLEMVLFP